MWRKGTWISGHANWLSTTRQKWINWNNTRGIARRHARPSDNPCNKIFIEYWPRMQETKQEMREIIPSSSGEITISMQTHQTRHTHSSSIFIYKVKRPRHLQLQKNYKSDAIFKKHKITHTDNWARRQTKMVGIQFIHHTPGYEKPHKNIHVTWKWSHVHSFVQPETQYKRLNSSGAGGQGWCNGTSTMDKVFPSSTRTACTDINNIARQQEHYIAFRKWNNIKLEKDASYQHTLFICSRQD